MKVKYLIIVQLVISCFSFSQEIDLKKKDINKGWYFGPNVSYSAINGFYNSRSGFDPQFRTNYFYFSGGKDAAYSFGRKYNIAFGIHYQEMRGSRTDYSWSIDSISNPSQIDNTFDRWSRKCIVLPVQMNFCLFKGPISPYLITGFSPSIFLSHTSVHRTTYFNGAEKETREHYSSVDNQYRDIDLLWQLGIGVDVSLNKSKFRAFIYNSGNCPSLFTPRVKYFFYSIHTGISYYFKK